MNPRPEPGSLHDPTAQVIRDGDRVVRVLDAGAREDFEALSTTPLWSQAQADGRIVATVRTGLPHALNPDRWVAAVEHETVPVVSYSAEWTFSMLRDAALLHLELLEEALPSGFVTKDGSASNIQFVGARPTFIDTASFTRLRAGEQWYGFRQFCEQFLNPLVLQSYGRLDLPHSVRGSVNGISPSAAARLLPRRARVRPALFTLIGLQAALERRYARRQTDVADELRAAGLSPAVLIGLVRKLRRVIRKLQWRAGESGWSDYSDRSHYDDDSLRAKKEFVARAVAEHAPRQLLDLGANDGAFSRLGLENGAAYAVAVDSDAAVIDRLYRDLRGAGDERLLPLCVDLADINGGMGWAGTERAALFQRLRPDLVLCLALFHHLAVSASVRVDAIVDFLASFGAPVLFELPLPTDPMVARLLARKRDRVLPGYDRASVERELSRRFHIHGHQTLPGGTRVVFELRPR